MAVQVFDAGVVTLTTSATDVSTYVESCRIAVSNMSVPTRSLGNTWGQTLPTNQKNYTVYLALKLDMATSNGTFTILNNALSSQGSLAWSAKLTTAVQGGTNPTLSGTASLDGDWDLVRLNSTPEDPVVNLTLKGNGTLTIATSST